MAFLKIFICRIVGDEIKSNLGSDDGVWRLGMGVEGVAGVEISWPISSGKLSGTSHDGFS